MNAFTIPAAARRTAAVPLLAAAAAPAWAHPGHAETLGGFLAGLTHPLGGLDHLLAMLAVGLWSAVALSAARRWTAPLGFVAAMTLGAFAARAGLLPLAGALEPLLGLSVLLLGALLAGGRRVAPGAGLALAAAAGALHGAAHGLEAAAAFGSYVAGFVLATTALHAAGLGASAWLQARGCGLALRGLGALIGLAGAALALARF